MTTDTPKNGALQPEQVKTVPTDYPITIERIDLPDDLPQDQIPAPYHVTKPKAT